MWSNVNNKTVPTEVTTANEYNFSEEYTFQGSIQALDHPLGRTHELYMTFTR